MSLTLGGDNSSFKSMRYLNDAKSKMDRSLLRISSGKRILSGADDPGGLSVSMKLQSQISTTSAAQSRVGNAKSYIEMQDSALSTAGDILNEMVTLESNYRSETNSSVKESYADQFKELQVQLNSLTSEKLNGVSLFSSGAQDNMTVYTGSSTTGATFSSSTVNASLVTVLHTVRTCGFRSSSTITFKVLSSIII